ncbi:hypothetical protein G3I40_12805 [Streptomyces sp. SID14478]|uniref:ATP-binding protein n=1 Tax=Streptomyces sp. SID14478 TaxID=2706073 RepID=UPI0013DA8B8D|nr:hypothetical protein [Streptomyces sp. SID14478]NEB76092.1 hypothetical protein [Streptomyces sp. SID14478]
MKDRLFLGRAQELRSLKTLLGSRAPVTVVGPAGTGKSALAARAARQFDGETVLVRWWDGPDPGGGGVRGVVRAALTAHTAAHADGAHAGRRVLLLLDDVDPVREDCIEVVQQVVDELPWLHVLVTSRQALGLGDERVVRLGCLPVRSPDGTAPGPAAELFSRTLRARTSGSRAVDTAGVAEVCRRTGGNPLALELAAHQARRRSLEELNALLAHGIGWLSDPHRAGPARHRSMSAAVGATYQLMGRRERIAWARVSVFSGEFDESGATFVCQGHGLSADLVPAALSRLATAAVLETVEDPGGVVPVRYRMPSAARSVGRTVLRATEEWQTAVDRHFTWQCTTADAACDLWHRGHQTLALNQLGGSTGDIRAALVRGTAQPERLVDALALMVDLWFWWGICGHLTEGFTLLQRLLRAAERAQAPVPARARWLAGWLAARLGHPETPLLLGDAARAALAEDDLGLLGQISDALALHAAFRGDRDLAITHLQDAVLFAPQQPLHGPPAAISWAVLACNQARLSTVRARTSIRKALSHPAARDDLWVRCTSSYAQALIHHLDGNKPKAWRRAHRALADATALDSPAGITLARDLIRALRTGTPLSPFLEPEALHGEAHPPSRTSDALRLHSPHP